MRCKVAPVNVLSENKSTVLVEVVGSPEMRLVISKFPLKQWQKTRGVFKTRSDAQAYLDCPLPRYNQEGEVIG